MLHVVQLVQRRLDGRSPRFATLALLASASMLLLGLAVALR